MLLQWTNDLEVGTLISVSILTANSVVKICLLGLLPSIICILEHNCHLKGNNILLFLNTTELFINIILQFLKKSSRGVGKYHDTNHELISNGIILGKKFQLFPYHESEKV